MGNEIYYDQRSITYIEQAQDGDYYTYKYNASGIRTGKNLNGLTVDYILEGTKVLKETRTDGKVLNYFYDQSGSIIGFKYNSNNYYYIKNLQNDIIGITNSNGNLIVTYVYDAYGSIVSITDTSGINLGKINPFRFKSYYFDEETKFYYLNSRYYDPFIGRFINADDIGVLADGELNLYAYCDNNPVMHVDPEGDFPWLIILGVIVVSYMLTGAVKAYNSASELGSTDWELAGYTTSGLIMGDYLPVKNNWVQISRDIDPGYQNGIIDFKFTNNEYYSIYTARLYS
ncbi:MAG: RHS repeat-associated core domain-containing protein [Bacilli bacterium]